MDRIKKIGDGLNWHTIVTNSLVIPDYLFLQHNAFCVTIIKAAGKITVLNNKHHGAHSILRN
jgi:hypothetical protein